MKITDLRVAIIGNSPVIRITTDEGIDGLGPVAIPRAGHIRWHVPFYKEHIVGEDPTNVERVMLKIRRMGAFKPWGSAVSGIEIALWDIAGKAAGVPVYKLLGGKVRDRVRTYNGRIRFPMSGTEPQDYADNMAKMKASPENFTIIKQGVAFHSAMAREIPGFFLGETEGRGDSMYHPLRGLLSERGLKHTIACVEAMKDVLGDEVGLALDCGPGLTASDTLRLAQALEPFNIMWMEDTVTGDYSPEVNPDLYLQITPHTSTPIHTGEQIYLARNFRELIEKHAVNVVGPDCGDVGGIAELKRVAELADLHGILIAPHGIGVGLIGLAAQVQVAAALPDNYIAFEYSTGEPSWWYDVLEGLPSPIVKDGFIDVWDTPGLGVNFNVEETRQYLSEEDAAFFDD